ncbi:MAG TPA: LysR substrate-binding domain-containing protein [Negativicutes bacterium]|jgi:DNA-binding transcriptional LysR family regulator
MDIRQLRYFISVAENLNFTEAARSHYVAQSAVSRQIADLEKRLGVDLFTRDKHSVSLTAAGRLLLQEAYIIVSRSDEAIEIVKQAAEGITGILKIGFLGVPLILPWAEQLRNFHLNHPHIQLHFNEFDAGSLTNELESRKIDIGFTRSISVQNNPSITWKKIDVDSICAVMRHDHPLATKVKIDFRSLENESFITISRLSSPGLYDHMLGLCSKNNFSPKIIKQPYHVETVLFSVFIGMGIAILPRCFEKSIPALQLKFVDIEGEEINSDLVVAWNKMSNNPSVALLLKNLLTKTS